MANLQPKDLVLLLIINEINLLILGWDGEESKMQAWLPIELTVKHFESLLIPMYA
jgi:hypothetical protein